MAKNLQTLRMRALEQPRRIVLVDGEDERVLEAAAYLSQNSRIQPILLGREAFIKESLPKHTHQHIEMMDPAHYKGLDDFAALYSAKKKEKGKEVPDRATMLKTVKNPPYFGSLLLESGEADGLVGGAKFPTSVILKAGIDVIGLMDEAEIISGSFCMYLSTALPAGQEVLVFSDCAVVPEPDSDQLAAIALNAAKVAKQVAQVTPKIAFLSFSTKGSADHPQVDKVRRACEKLKETLPDAFIDGEIQADAALIPEIAERKTPDSLLQGEANVLIFPDLNAGNIAYKLVERLAKAKALGVILEGFQKPVNDLSRGCSVEDIIDTVCVTVLQSEATEWSA